MLDALDLPLNGWNKGRRKKDFFFLSNFRSFFTKDQGIKTADKTSTSNKRAKSTKIGLKETESNTVSTDLGIVIDHNAVNNFKRYDVNGFLNFDMS